MYAYREPEIFHFEFLFNFHTEIQQEFVYISNMVGIAW